MSTPKQIRLSQQEWQAILQDWRKSGQTAPHYCAAFHITVDTGLKRMKPERFSQVDSKQKVTIYKRRYVPHISDTHTLAKL
jgi:hypothetical protein